MTDSTARVPGFDFLQNMMKGAAGAVPAMGQWIAPTINPEELEKRISELKTVKFWLEQNTRMLDATIQAMEVQRMTLATLKTMNLSMSDLRDSMRLKTPATATEPSPKAAPTKGKKKPLAGGESNATPTPAAPGAVDPMQWWGALTKQFGELANNAVKESSTEVAKNLAKAVPAAVASAVSNAVSSTVSNAVGGATKKVAARKKPARG